MRAPTCAIFRRLLKGPNSETVLLARRVQKPFQEQFLSTCAATSFIDVDGTCCTYGYSAPPGGFHTQFYQVTSAYSKDVALPRSASYLQNDSKATVILLGTVHFSKQSVEEVSQIVKILNPNAILVELCRQRVSLLELDDKKFLEDAKNFDSRKLKEAAKGQSFVSGMLHAMLLKTYADIAKELGVAPGGEFRRAYHEMKKIRGCKLFLGDRPIQITIARAFQTLSVYELGQVLYHLTTSNPKPLDKAQLERYKDKDFVQAQFEEITRDVPAFKKIFHVFVDERDKCLAYSIQECVRTVKEPRVLAVVGMGHVDGIQKYYGKMKQEDIVPLLLCDCDGLYAKRGAPFEFSRGTGSAVGMALHMIPLTAFRRGYNYSLVTVKQCYIHCKGKFWMSRLCILNGSRMSVCMPQTPMYYVIIRKGLKLTFYFLIFSFFYRIIFG